MAKGKGGMDGGRGGVDGGRGGVDRSTLLIN